MWMNSLRLGSIVILCSLLWGCSTSRSNRLVGQSLNWINQLFKICHLIIYLWVSAKITQAQHIPNKAYKGGDFMLEFGAFTSMDVKIPFTRFSLTPVDGYMFKVHLFLGGASFCFNTTNAYFSISTPIFI